MYFLWTRPRWVSFPPEENNNTIFRLDAMTIIGERTTSEKWGIIKGSIKWKSSSLSTFNISSISNSIEQLHCLTTRIPSEFQWNEIFKHPTEWSIILLTRINRRRRRKDIRANEKKKTLSVLIIVFPRRCDAMDCTVLLGLSLSLLLRFVAHIRYCYGISCSSYSSISIYLMNDGDQCAATGIRSAPEATIWNAVAYVSRFNHPVQT